MFHPLLMALGQCKFQDMCTNLVEFVLDGIKGVLEDPVPGWVIEEALGGHFYGGKHAWFLPHHLPHSSRPPHHTATTHLHPPPFNVARPLVFLTGTQPNFRWEEARRRGGEMSLLLPGDGLPEISSAIYCNHLHRRLKKTRIPRILGYL